ncbi:LSU ribosomal protein L6P [Magnetococcus marinus MC-1]|uniref:Large ribosomal subunit protein uL6 n=1 Tax=Magnetococcus marinus (strain ATCC BAA-1437 / JCM 17883 / MC-1) TaxID=156889 RepID=RL6_MAGMM|nr:50S ribosomal protein L6 [Magnetococcus marinus]A0L5Y8.1 RecName: Full=Large ribosomal subunit protein uL6; AltName: Full=50S ribosomal protein L6 [Magnetococcus marinus MC-1]ABK43381.1 LSU ribosomal protein L6P [Magnetococcus marinus MC-1]
MSRIGKKPVVVPDGVDLKINGTVVTAKGKLGELTRQFHEAITFAQEGKEVNVAVSGTDKKSSSLWGLSRTLLDNMVVGVSQGFSKQLEIQGVGYRAAVKGRTLELSLGFSHPVNYELPNGLEATVEKNTLITVKGYDKEVLGQACAEIRSWRPPEPYKGKGVRYVGEFVLRKEGKKK